MAIAKKGLRSIVVNQKKFYWKFNGKVWVIPEEESNTKLLVDFGWYDTLLYVNDKENEPDDFEPKVVTPGFVKMAILFALENDWQKGGLEIVYKNKSFSNKQS